MGASLTQKEELFVSINKRDKGLLETIIKGLSEHPVDLQLLTEKIDGKSHLNFLEHALTLYDENSDNWRSTDILTGHHEAIEGEWKRLLKSSIAFLRKNDDREPYKKAGNGGRLPTAYGVDDLHKYFRQFVAFEDILYGGVRWYRDHVVHAYRVWLLGMDILLRKTGKNRKIVNDFQDELGVDGFDERRKSPKGTESSIFTYSLEEIFCSWTITAMTHDLGYPLEKAPDLLRAINAMVTNFVATPDVKHDFRFNAAADSVNDYIVRLISTKMVLKKPIIKDNPKSKVYSGRIQPKYYVKFLKSLESNKHGVISAILLYKHLVFFLESECNICEDYHFNAEEVRQFYIRREILRAIATHTCDDVYQMYSTNFSFLLFFSDELQDWGRNKYHGIKKDDVYMHPPTFVTLTPTNFSVHQKYLILHYNTAETNKRATSLYGVFDKVYKEYVKFVKVFRDGIDTENRLFSYEKKITIEFDKYKGQIEISYKIPHNKKAEIVFSQYATDNDVSANVNDIATDIGIEAYIPKSQP